MTKQSLHFRRWLPSLCALALLPVAVQARTFLVDLNSSRGYRGIDPVSPDANGSVWNAFPHPATGASQLNGLADTGGNSSALDFGSITPFGSDSYNGPAGATAEPVTPAMVGATDIDAAALGDLGGSKEAAFDYIATEPHIPAGQASAVNDARFAIQGLDPQLTYTLKLFGSRKYAAESTTVYEAFSDPGFEYLSASAGLEVCDAASPGNHNRGNAAILAGIRPSASGAIYLRVRAEGGAQGYLNSMQIVEGTRPVDSRGVLYVQIVNPATGREIVSDPDLGPLTRHEPPATNLRGHWYLMTRTDNSLVWIVNRVTGEALRAAADSGPVSTVPWNPDDPRQTWRVTTTDGVSRLRIEGTGATLTVATDGAPPTVGDDAPGNTAQAWILPELPRGGAFPWTTYDEENAGALGAPAEVVRSAYAEGPVPLAAEAQKRGVILLNSYGTYVRWTAAAPADAMTLRYSVSDGDAGTITLRLSRSGSTVAEKKIVLTSAQAWVYFDSQGNELQSPGTGRTPAKRFNEARIKLDTPMAAGDTVELRRDDGDTMVWIDALEAEASEIVPLPEASAYLVATDLGATGDGITNDTVALKNAIAAAASQGKKLYLPPGTYRLEEEIILPPGFVLQGAGMWKTELVFSRAAASPYSGQALGGIKATGSSTVVRDVYMKSAQGARSLGYHALKGSWGAGSLIENVWAEHFETGAWIADFSNDGSIYTDGLVIRNCRLRNAFADGVNFASGTRNSAVENTHVRGCGDDGLASYASGRTLNKPTTRNIQFRYNTIECVYRAGGIGIFGGEGHKIHRNIIRDQVAGPGLRLNTIFVYLNGALEGYPFGSQLIQFFDNTLERTGSLTVFNEQAAAIELQSWYTDVENIRFTDIAIDTTRYEGIRYSRVGQVSSAGFGNIVFTRVGFANAPFGTLVTSQASGESSFDTQSSAAGVNNQSANFTVNGPPPPPPVITSFAPAVAGRGSEVTITGNHLSSAQLVQVGAQTAANFTVVSDGTLKFVVPPDAVDGRIRITTAFDAYAVSEAALVIPQNNANPAVTLGLPNSVSVPEGSGLLLSATASDDGLPDPPGALSCAWSVATAPPGGGVAFDDASQLSTGATFSTAGNYLLRLTVSDGQLTTAADIAVAYGGSATGTGMDIGGVGLAGSSAAADGLWAVHASGADIWDAADGFHFRYAELRGDGFVQVRLLGQTNTDPWAKAGVMIRDDLAPGSTHAMLVGTTGNGLAFQNRPTTGALSQHQALGAYSYGVWLRLVRSGATITAYRSDNGMTWTQVGTSVSPAMADPVYIGLAVTSHNNAALTTATFDNLQGSGFGAQAPSVSAGNDITASLGDSASLSGSASGFSGVSWSLMSGPGPLAFGSPSDLATAVTAAAAGLYRIRLTATSGTIETFDECVLAVEDDSKTEAAVNISSPAATYDGRAKTAIVTTVPPDLPVEVTYNGSPSPPSNAGTYGVLARILHPNYRGTASATLVIAKADAAVNLSDASIVATYDGAPKSAAATTVPLGLAVVITYNGSPSPPVNAGTYAVNALVNDANYQGGALGTLVIGKARATIGLGNLHQTYDGASKTVSVTTSPPGLQVAATYDGSPGAPVNAGAYAVNLAVNDPNYDGTAADTLFVGKAAAVIALGNLAAVYDGTPKAPTATTSPAGLDVNLAYNGSPAAPSEIGAYTVTATVTDANYEGSAAGTFVIGLESPAVNGAALVDFGPTPTPVVAGAHWNNFTNAAPGYALTNLVTTANAPTGYAVSMSTVNAINTDWIPPIVWSSNNATALGEFNVQTAMTDGFYVQPNQGTRGVRISGLNSSKAYTVRIYGGRNAAETRATAYTVRGGNTNTGALTNSGSRIGVGGVDFNNRNVLSVTNAAPDASGTLYVEYTCKQGSFGYLNALSVEESASPTISAGGALPALSSTYGSPSTAALFAVSAANLKAAITVAAPPGFEIATNAATGFAGSITLGTQGDLAATAIHARIAARTAAGTHSGNIIISSPGASTRTVAIPSGTVLPALLGAVTFSAPQTLASDGTSKAFTAEAADVGSFTYSYSGRVPTPYGPTSSPPSAPGLYAVTATPDSNFTGSAQQNFFITGPLAADDSVNAAPATPSSAVEIPVASLLANDLRVDGEGNIVGGGLTLVALGPTGGGAQPQIAGPVIVLALAAPATETFSYTVADANGSQGTATVVLGVGAASPPAIGMFLVGSAIYDAASDTTSVTHRFVGKPHESAAFEYSERIGAAFRDHSRGGYAPAIQADAGGIFQLGITEAGDHAAAWNSMMFFRAGWPQ